MTPEQYIIKGRMGISTKTIWAALMGVVREPTQCGGEFDVPHDPDDFERCFTMLSNIPFWRERLDEVAAVFPKWGPMVREWDTLEALFEEEAPKGRCPKLYDKMSALEDEGMLLDGWKQDGPGSWTCK